MVNCLMHSAVQKAEKAIFLWLIFDLSFSLSKKNWDKDGSMDPLSDVDHITRGHLSEKTSLLIRVNIFLNLLQKCSYSNLPIIPNIHLST